MLKNVNNKYMANPIKIIKDDHRVVEKLFKKFETLGDRAFTTKKELAHEIIATLRLHADMEEILYYPPAKEAFNNEDDKMVEEALAEHEVAKGLMEEIENLDPKEPQFEAKMKVLNEAISHHVKEEEEELLPATEEKIKKEDLEKIGDEMLLFKDESK